MYAKSEKVQDNFHFYSYWQWLLRCLNTKHFENTPNFDLAWKGKIPRARSTSEIFSIFFSVLQYYFMQYFVILHMVQHVLLNNYDSDNI